MLLISPLSYGPLVYLAATIWALVGGVTIIGTAVSDRFKSRRQKQVEKSNTDKNSDDKDKGKRITGPV